MKLKNKINLFLFIFTALSICLILFLIYPLFRDIKNQSSEIISQKQSLASLEERAENFDKFRIKYRKIETDLEKISGLFINPEIPVDFIGFLEKTSRDSGISAKISPALPSRIKDDPWPSLIFQISAAGSLSDILKFLEKLESSIYLIEIQNLNIVRLTEAELRAKEYERFSLNGVRAALSIKVYTR